MQETTTMKHFHVQRVSSTDYLLFWLNIFLQPTSHYGYECSANARPYINNCDYNGAYEVLNHIYGDLQVQTHWFCFLGDPIMHTRWPLLHEHLRTSDGGWSWGNVHLVGIFGYITGKWVCLQIAIMQPQLSGSWRVWSRTSWHCEHQIIVISASTFWGSKGKST